MLNVYAFTNPSIGYCQSMNCKFDDLIIDILVVIAAVLLLYLTEEESYWLLSIIIEDMLPQDYYSMVCYQLF